MIALARFYIATVAPQRRSSLGASVGGAFFDRTPNGPATRRDIFNEKVCSIAPPATPSDAKWSWLAGRPSKEQRDTGDFRANAAMII